jgi:adenylate kinase family enzyme
MPKIVILGNSGSGKSTLALALARGSGFVHLDLDTLAWDPAAATPARRRLDDSLALIGAFLRAHDDWVIEGCYADLLASVTPHCTRLIFLNPGVEACIANCRARPWEPHKYPSKAAQDEGLEFLLGWVREYATRTDEFSLLQHRRLFDGFRGDKEEFTARPRL